MAKGDYNWLIGAGLGFALGGPLGALVGGVLGSQLHHVTNRFSPDRDGVRGIGREDSREYYTGQGQEGDLIVSFLVLSAAITKADNEVRASEVRVLKEYLVRSFGMSRAVLLMKFYKEILEKPVDLDAVLAQIRENADEPFKHTVLQILYEIAWADEELADAEKAILSRIAQGLGIPGPEARSTESYYRHETPDRDYVLLETTANASDDDVKSKYRELVKKYHPDKVGHLGDEFKALAEKKFKEISAAYERIRKSRGF
ncbi:MAG: TerB family tellurite resistance protein [Fibrobacterota bacterium]